MIARCARCQGTFTTDRFGRQTCPHCGSDLMLQDPSAPQPPGGPQQGAPSAGAPPPGTPPSPPASAGEPPSPRPPPTVGGYGPPAGSGAPPGAWGPPPGGAPPPGGFGGPPGGGWRGPPPGSGPELPSPFAERATRGFFASFFETWKLVATQPAEFFRRVRPDQPGSAILFGVIATTVGNTLTALYSWLQMASGMAGLEQMMQKMPGNETRFLELYKANLPLLLLASVVLAPVITFLWTYIVAGVVHLLLKLFKGTKRPFDATLTAVGYANGLNLLMVVPGCGGLIALVWGLVVLVIGLGEIQRCGSGKAAAAIFTPAILVCVCCCAILGVSAPAFLKGIEEAAKQGKSVNL